MGKIYGITDQNYHISSIATWNGQFFEILPISGKSGFAGKLYDFVLYPYVDSMVELLNSKLVDDKGHTLTWYFTILITLFVFFFELINNLFICISIRSEFLQGLDKNYTTNNVLDHVISKIPKLLETDLNLDPASINVRFASTVKVYSFMLIDMKVSTDERFVPLEINGIPNMKQTRVCKTPYFIDSRNSKVENTIKAFSNNDKLSMEYNAKRFGTGITHLFFLFQL